VHANALDAVSVLVGEDDVIEAGLANAAASRHVDATSETPIRVHDEVVRRVGTLAGVGSDPHLTL
jgi:predicted transcriptional regulator